MTSDCSRSLVADAVRFAVSDWDLEIGSSATRLTYCLIAHFAAAAGTADTEQTLRAGLAAASAVAEVAVEAALVTAVVGLAEFVAEIAVLPALSSAQVEPALNCQSISAGASAGLWRGTST